VFDRERQAVIVYTKYGPLHRKLKRINRVLNKLNERLLDKKLT
jgi:hypothetical protein